MADHDSTQHASAEDERQYSLEELIDTTAKTVSYLLFRGVPPADAEDSAAHAYREARRRLEAAKPVDSLPGLMRRMAWCFYSKQVHRREKNVPAVHTDRRPRHLDR
ncbi:hypothetical protein LP52_05505 [Streptomonospora alba]|uniref:Uncharacterized protein n=1 Tax=Streptomonospora alba TaxID=183763 RepID=A0A0C2FK18_9ACTN|nr:hypothetical protein [Streptomonospora alba]KIH99699.1 hypothetical protein LP52_05505 [Streptomonospora alba]